MVDGLLCNCTLTTKDQPMNKETGMQGYSDEMEMGDFLSEVYTLLSNIRTGVWLLVGLEAAKFLLW